MRIVAPINSFAQVKKLKVLSFLIVLIGLVLPHFLPFTLEQQMAVMCAFFFLAALAALLSIDKEVRNVRK